MTTLNPYHTVTASRPAAGREKSVTLRKLTEGGVLTSLVLCGLFSLLTTLAIIYTLSHETIAFFRFDGVSLKEFLFGLRWSPLLGAEKHFGVWPLVCGTLMITVVAMLFAGPLGLITAIWLSEYAPPRVRNLLKPVLEILAGVPTVVLGFFALTFITPALQFAFIPRPAIGPDGRPLLDAAGNIITQPWNPFGIEGYNILAAGIAVGILTLPIVTSLAEDALRAVPRQLREGSYGLGATRFETSIRVIFPAALSGIIAAMLLAIARCVGETMIVALAAGGTHLPLHHITEPPLVAHQWHVGSATIPAGESHVTPPFALDDDEKVGPVHVEGSAEHLQIELLASNGDAIAQCTLNGTASSGTGASPVHSPPWRLAHGRGAHAAGQSFAHADAVAVDAGEYRVRVTPLSGDAELSLIRVDGERFMPLASRLATPIDVRRSAQPMTGYLVQIFLGDVSNLGVEYYSSYAVAALLFVMTFALTIIGQIIRVRFQQTYE